MKRLLDKRVIIIASAVLAVVLLVTAIVVYNISVEQNKTLHTTRYTVSHEEIPAAFEGKKIVHLSDLHNKDWGDQLTDIVKAEQPDVIVITGDWISRNNKDITTAKKQLKALEGIAPTYYVTGNHEAFSALYAELYYALVDSGVTVLENQAIDWVVDGESVQLIGVFDPDYSTHLWRDFAPLVDEERYSILLYHHPEYMETAASFGADLILSGHTHGGQIRLPLIGAVYAPNQGLFPKYDVGRIDEFGATMIISQGLGEGAYMRILAPPEVVVVTLDSPYV